MEIWKQVIDLNGNKTDFEVSNYGRVKRIKTQHILKIGTINSGYMLVEYSETKKYRRRELLHRLVARHFCEGYEKSLDVNHKDGNRLNNCADNLEWLTRKENIRDCINRGTFNASTAQQIAKIKNQKKINQYTLDGLYIKTYNSAKETGVAKAAECANGNRKTADGYLWKWHKDDDIV